MKYKTLSFYNKYNISIETTPYRNENMFLYVLPKYIAKYTAYIYPKLILK